MSRIEKVVSLLTRWLNWIAAAAIIVVMIIVCANVIGRGFFGSPFKGTVDIVSLLGAFIIAGAMAYTQVLKGHIRIELFVERMPSRLQYIINSFIDLIGFCLFALISWQTVLFAQYNMEIGELSEVLKLPLTPFASVVAIGCIALTLVLLLDLIKSVSKAVGK
ncbi:MAG: TRAP transporter small permease [Deltaproteobacteria bacterium]|nr:TRAP transporter small permease [Deltaproteobacteria bacterium]